MFTIFKVKRYVVGGSVLGTFLLVYGTAIVFRLLMGHYFMVGGLADPNYILLALLCGIPFVVGSLISLNKSPKMYIETMFMSSVLFSVLFMTIHGVLVFWTTAMTDGVLVRTLIVFPVSALLIVVAAYIGVNMAKPARER